MWSVESDTDQILKSVLQGAPSVPDSITHLGNTKIQWWEGKPGDAVVMAEGGSPEDRWLGEQVVIAQLEAIGYKRARFSFESSITEPEDSLWRYFSDDQDRFMHNGCGPLAFEIHKKTGWPMCAIYNPEELKCKEEGEEYYHPDHVFIQHPSGQALDIRGLSPMPSNALPLSQEQLEKSFEAEAIGIPEEHPMADQVATSLLRKLGTFKTAGWADIMQKAKRLVQSGDVTLLRNGWSNIVAHVIGDHGEYTCEIGRDDPESRSITTWQCECPWDQYAWQRTRKWKKYEGRPCAHVLAAFWKSQATPLDEGPPEGQNLPPGQKTGPPTPVPMGGGGGGAPAGPPMPKPNEEAVPQQRSFGPEEALGESAMGPPGQSGILPTPPMDQLAEQMPPVPGQTPGGVPANPNIVSVPGAKVPSPFNPIQFPGGTYSSKPPDPPDYRKGTDKEHCGNCKMNDNGHCWRYGNKEIRYNFVCDSWTAERVSKVAAEEFVAPEIVRLKNDGYGVAEGKSEEHGAGQYQTIPAGSNGEVLGQDQSTGWVEVIFPLNESSYLEPYHVKMFCEPNELEHTDSQPASPFIRRR